MERSPVVLLGRASLSCWILLAALSSGFASAQLPSFNGAEGFGGTFSGSVPAGGWFANASVYHVTTTADTIDASTGKPAIGTLRGAFYDYTNPNSPKQMASNRIVVFDVGGVFQLTQGSLDIKTVNNIYVAGQTAPSPVTVYGNTTQITKSSNTMTSNVILRYMTFRKGTGDGEDAITFAGGDGDGDTIATNMILDHVSASWSEDEDLSVANNNTNVTVQYSIIADSLTSGHAYGSLIRPRVDSNVTYHHNLYANNSSRQPRPGTYYGTTLTFDFRNNVVYNWRDRAGYSGGSSEAEQELVNMNYVGNYMVAGAGTTGNVSGTFLVDKNVDLTAYNQGNFVDSDKSFNPGGVPNGAVRGANMIQLNAPVTDQSLVQVGAPFASATVTTQAAPDAFSQIISYVGNYWWSREAIDARIINNVNTNTGPPDGIAAAAPNAAELSALLATPTIARPADWDTDQDGMPDEWEFDHGLSPNSAADNRLDFDNDGYVNVQEYLDEIGGFRAPAPIVFNGATNNRYAMITNWKTSDGMTSGSNWQPARWDEAQINSGTVVVDAVGQHAYDVKIGAQPGSNATLNITGGWLRAENRIVIGDNPAATAALNLSGGTLFVYELMKGTGGAFSFTGGKLLADYVRFSLVNNGGTIAPGYSLTLNPVDVPTSINIGRSLISGDLTLNSGTLEIEISSTATSDHLDVAGVATLGGDLQVVLADGYTPYDGEYWWILDSNGHLGQFATITNGFGVQWQGNSLQLYYRETPIPLPGDFNLDGTVDTADYVVWRRSDGTQQGYDTWRAHFGLTQTSSGSSVSSPAGVPEPDGLMPLLMACLMCWAGGRMCAG